MFTNYVTFDDLRENGNNKSCDIMLAEFNGAYASKQLLVRTEYKIMRTYSAFDEYDEDIECNEVETSIKYIVTVDTREIAVFDYLDDAIDSYNTYALESKYYYSSTCIFNRKTTNQVLTHFGPSHFVIEIAFAKAIAEEYTKQFAISILSQLEILKDSKSVEYVYNRIVEKYKYLEVYDHNSILIVDTPKL